MKPLKDFAPVKGNSDGYSHICRACRNDYFKRRRQMIADGVWTRQDGCKVLNLKVKVRSLGEPKEITEARYNAGKK